MKIKWIVLLLLVVHQVQAQHCPFDGYSVIVVHFTQPVPKDAQLVLQQVHETATDSCMYGNSIDGKLFMNNKNSAFLEQGTTYINWFHRLLENDFDFTKDNYFVFLTSSERYCIQKENNSNNYLYTPKKFKLLLLKNNNLLQTYSIPETALYSMCTGSGKWSRIKPLQIIIKD